MINMFLKYYQAGIELKIRQIRKSVSDPLNLRQLLLALITNLAKELNLESISFLLLNKEDNEFILKESIKNNHTHTILSINSPIVTYFQTKRGMLFSYKINHLITKLKSKNNAKQANLDMLHDLSNDMNDIQSTIAIPIYNENTLIGIISIGKRKNNRAFKKIDFNFIDELITEFTPIIISAVKYEELQEKESQISALYKVGKIINSLSDFKKIFEIIIENASILLKSPKILILTMTGPDSHISIKKTLGFSDFELRKIAETIRFKECTHMQTNDSSGILIKTRRNNTFYEEEVLKDLNINSIICAPLLDESFQIIGELRAMRPGSQKPFNTKDLEIATNLSSNISVAINNSKQYRKSEEHLLELSTVYNITKSLTSEFELEKTQKKVCSIFTDVLNFNRVILYLYKENNTLIPISSSGWSEDTYKSISLDINKSIEGKSLVEGRILQVNKEDLSDYDTSAIEILKLNNFVLIPLLIINKKPIGVFIIDTDQEKMIQKKLNLRLLTAIANQSAVIIENATLYNESEILNTQLKKEQARTSKELQIARYIQQGLLSSKLPLNNAIDIYATNIPCRSVGGDFYNFIEYDELNMGTVIGDVSGKGIPAALLMTMTNNIFSEFGKTIRSPETILKQANESLQNYLKKSPLFYVTAFYGVINFEKNILKYCKAGHNPPLFYRTKTDTIEFLDSEGAYLGTFDDCGFIEKNMILEKGDKLILYTDGITEARNHKGKMFRKERLGDLIKNNSNLSAKNLTKLILRTIEDYTGKQEFSDDLTIVIFDFLNLKPFKEKNICKVSYKFNSDLEKIKIKVKDILNKLEVLDISPRQFKHFRLSLSEAILNAMEHGNKKDPKKKITITEEITNRKVLIQVEDEGSGFDQEKLQFYENKKDINHRGRGITTIKACMDEVFFNTIGNKITLIKYL